MRRILVVLLTLCLLLGMVPGSVFAADGVAKGKCGLNVTWELDSEGRLLIYGSGEIDHTQTVTKPAWKNYTGLIKSVEIKEGVTSIGAESFAGCSNITQAILPGSLTSIGDSAFYNCWQLSEVVLPDNLENLGESAFAKTGIAVIAVPEKITTVSISLFSECKKLTSVTFRGPIKDIGASAFYSCEALETVNFEKGISGAIQQQAFHGCTKLKAFPFSEGIDIVREHAFAGCKSLVSVTLPESLESIWSSAFAESGLVSITIPQAVYYMGSHVFVSCYQLQNITMYTETVEGLKGSLGGEEALEYVHIIGNAPQTEDAIIRSRKDLFVIYYDEGTSGWIPPTWKDNIIEIWGKEDMSKTGTCGESLTWLLKAGVLTISGTGVMDHYERGAAPWYLYRERVHRVEIEEGVTSIGNYAFYGLHKLESVALPGSLKTIGSNSFWDCQQLKEVDVPEGVESIGGNAFWYCSALTKVTMADSVTAIGSDCFSECRNLTTVRLSEGLTEISQGLFVNCVNLTSVNIPANATVINDNAFVSCCSLTALTISDAVSSIGYGVFKNSGLEELTLPASIATIEAHAFYDCMKLQRVRFLGDAPAFSDLTFQNVDTVCIYPTNNTTWTEEVKQNYGGTILWIADEHTHSYEAIFVEPTCKEQGYHGQRCICGHVYVEEYVDSLGHDMAPATCENPSTCRRENCDFWTGSTTEHTWENPCLTTRACSVCGYSDNEGGHDWSSTYDETRYCYACGAFEGGYLLDLSELDGTAWIDGVECPFSYHNGFSYAILKNADAKTMVTYSYANLINQDRHTQYPTGMKVWKLTLEGNRYKATYIAEFENLLQYAGSSIRITGTKGIRMITAIEKSKKEALTGDGLAGYKLVEYGTALCWAKDLEGGNPMTLGNAYVKSNYAYKRGVADPVFAQTDTLIQYTNVLVGFNLDQCKDDIAMRPYIVLEDADGTQVTVYGGIVYRSIGYIAYQNRNVFQAGTSSYYYVWEIIRHVYGGQYDAEFKG